MYFTNIFHKDISKIYFILTFKPYSFRVQLSMNLSPPFKFSCMFSFEKIVVLGFFSTFHTFQVEMQTDGPAPCPSSGLSCYPNSPLRVKFSFVQRVQAGQVAWSFQLNKDMSLFLTAASYMSPGFTSLSQPNLHLKVCYPEESHQGQSIRQMAVWPSETGV